MRESILRKGATQATRKRYQNVAAMVADLARVKSFSPEQIETLNRESGETRPITLTEILPIEPEALPLQKRRFPIVSIVGGVLAVAAVAFLLLRGGGDEPLPTATPLAAAVDADTSTPTAATAVSATATNAPTNTTVPPAPPSNRCPNCQRLPPLPPPRLRPSPPSSAWTTFKIWRRRCS
ncbi:MAG: hypothetical protein H6652_03985 [Ardenticatenaceae bacterium]|nr:hypothetical protein [Ardenticatenaceae bacterium]